MKKFIRMYLFASSLTYVLTVLAVAVLNIMAGNRTGADSLWYVQAYLFIWVIDGVDYLLGRVDFPSSAVFYAAELILTYLVMLLFGRVLNWFRSDMASVLAASAAFLLIFGLVQWFFYRENCRQSEEINRML